MTKESTSRTRTRIDARIRVDSAAWWLKASAGSMAAFIVFFVISCIVLTINLGWGFALALPELAFMSMLAWPFPLLVFFGALMLSRRRLWGLVLIADFVSFALGALAILGTIVLAISPATTEVQQPNGNQGPTAADFI